MVLYLYMLGEKMKSKKPSYLNNLDKLHLYPEKLVGWMASKNPDEDMDDWEWAAYCMEWEKTVRMVR